MRKYVLMVLVLLIIFVAGSSLVIAEDNSLEKIKEKGVIVVGLDDNFPPMGFRDDNGNIVGFDIDLAKEAAKRMGVEVVFKPVEWDGVIFSLKNGTIDLIWNGMTITPERAEQIDFSKPYLDNRQIVIVKEDSGINSKKDLEGKVLGLQMGSSSENALNKNEDLVNSIKEVRRYSNNTEALMDLQFGRLDAVVVDEIVGRYYISKKPGIYKVLKEDLDRESYGVGIRKGEDSFRKELDRILDEMKEDGTAAKISKKWFGEDIVKK